MYKISIQIIKTKILGIFCAKKIWARFNNSWTISWTPCPMNFAPPCIKSEIELFRDPQIFSNQSQTHISWHISKEINPVSRFFSGFFPDFHQIFIFLHRLDGILHTYDMMIFFRKFIRFPDFFPDFSGSSLNLQIYTHNIWYDGFLFRKIIWLPDFFRIFSGFSLNLHISSQTGWYTSYIWYEDFFPEIYSISGFFSGFLSYLQIHSFL